MVKILIYLNRRVFVMYRTPILVHRCLDQTINAKSDLGFVVYGIRADSQFDIKLASPCENVSSGICGQQSPDQPAHPHSLIRVVSFGYYTIV